MRKSAADTATSGAFFSVCEGMTDAFPETRSSILCEAARGEWDRFVALYLRPCWKEIVFACRERHVPLGDADDLFQELCLRLLKEGELRPISDSAEVEPPASFRGNLPAKYLRYCEMRGTAARFRTFLKSVIRNLLLEHLRARQRRQRKETAVNPDELEAWVEYNVAAPIERHWMAECLCVAAEQFHEESKTARTAGRRRLFDVLFLEVCEHCSAAEIASRLQLDRSTVAGLLSQARLRFLELLQQLTGISQKSELKALVANIPEAFPAAMMAARQFHRS